MTIRSGLFLAAVVAASSLLAEPVTRIWKGGTLNANDEQPWSESANWENGCPVNGDSVVITNTVAKNTRQDIKSLELVNMFYVDDGVGAAILGSPVTLTGEKSFIRATTKTVHTYLGINLTDDAVFRFDGDGTVCLANNNLLSGTGTVIKEGAAKYFYANYEQPDFDGVWELKTGTIYIENGKSIPVHPLGSSKCRIRVYGADCAAGAGTSAGLNITRAAALDGDLFLYDRAGVTVYQTVTFNGDVHIARSANTKTTPFSGYLDASKNDDAYPAGFVFNGDFKVQDGGLFSFYNYGYGPRFLIEFNGEHANFGGSNFAISKQVQGGVQASGSVIRARAAISTVSGKSLFTFNSQDRFFCEKPNVLSADRDVNFGTSSTSTFGAILDLQGNDQTVGATLFYGGPNGENDSIITSSTGPATYHTSVNAGGKAYRTVPYLNGQVSYDIRGSSSNAGAYPFKGGNTTGWIKSCWPINLATTMPNLGGIEVYGNCVATITADTSVNEGARLDVHDLTNGYVSVAADVDFKTGGVTFNDVDLPAGTYDKTAAWIKGDGTATVAAHDPMLVWTGKGADAGLLTAGNWGANTAPDLTDTALTLDFRRATAETPIALTGTVAPACVLSSGPIGQGRPTFAGTGTLVLADAGTVTNNYAFTGSSALTWNGTGTLVLKGSASTTDGTLTVASGKVVLDASSWVGKVVVASGAELEVLTNCGSEVFGAADGNSCVVELDGKLTLGEGIAASVKELYVAGKLVRRNKTYGSTESPAEKADDVYFGGTGTILSQTPTGLLLLFR